MAITPSAGYIIDPSNPNSVIKDPNYGAMPGSVQAINQTNATTPSIAYGAITPSSLAPATPLTVPPPPPTPDYSGATTGAITGASTAPKTYTTPTGAVVDTAGNIITPPPVQTQPITSLKDRITNVLGTDISSFLTKPTSTLDTYKELQTQNDIANKTKAVDDLSAQLAEINASRNVAQLQLEKNAEGRGITTDVLNRQQAQSDRDYAIKALPITAQLNAAQGRLDSANKNIETLLNLVTQDQQNQYQYQKDLISNAMTIASSDQKDALQLRSEQLDVQKAKQDEFNTLKSGYIQAAIQVGDYKTAGLMASATDNNTLSSLVSQIKSSNANLQIVESGGGIYAVDKTTGTIKTLKGATPTGSGTPVLTPEQSADPFIKKLLASKGGKALTDTPLQQINKGLTVLGQLGALQTNINNTSTGPILGAFKGANPWDTNAQTIKAQLNAIVPNLARGIYGEVGVLTDNDIKTYSKTIGNLTSTNDVNNAIMYITLDLIGKSIKNTLEVQAAGGRDVSGFIDIYTGMENTKNSILQTLPANNQTLQQLGVTKEDENLFNSVTGTGDVSYGGFFSNIWKGLTGN